MSGGRPVARERAHSKVLRGPHDIGCRGRLLREAQGGRGGPRHRAHGTWASLVVPPENGDSRTRQHRVRVENFAVDTPEAESCLHFVLIFTVFSFTPPEKHAPAAE